jgi:nitroreductase
MPAYNLTTEVWETDEDDFPSEGSIEEKARFLLRYAVLAPSSHNSQPWEFGIDGRNIEVYPSEERWLEVADPDKRELYISLGCAIGNLCVAAQRFDIGCQVEYNEDTPVSVVTLDPNSTSSTRSDGLFGGIKERRTNHQLFEDRPIPEDLKQRLRDCVTEDEVELRLIQDSDTKDSIEELQARADRLLMEDAEYRKELGYWVGTGALGDSWLKARIGQAVITHLNIGDSEAQKNSKLMRSAPSIGVLVGKDSTISRVKTGQVFERISLTAATEGVAVHPMSQILEQPELRGKLGDVLGEDDLRPQHLFRIGYAEERREKTPRWPLEKFLVE